MNRKYSRRQFLSSLGHGVVATTAVTCPAKGFFLSKTKSGREIPANRPNIVVVMADDMGFSDVGCYGSEIRTPNIDRLAAEGLRCTHFYNGAVCCPTRASLLTGLYAHQTGLGFMVHDPQIPTQLAGKGYPAYLGYLNDRCVTIAEALKLGGYRTLMSGKWHVGETRPHWPVDRGFDRYFGLISGGANYFDVKSGMKAPYFPKDGIRRVALDGEMFEPDAEGFYMTDAITDYAVKFLDDEDDKTEPFFLYVSYTAPHVPLQALPEDIARYRGKYMKGWDRLREERYERMMTLGIIDRNWKLTPRDANAWSWEEEKNKELMDMKMAIYAAQIDRMDQGIGKILDKIAHIGAEENTLVLFLSDNGGASWGGPTGINIGKDQVPPGNVNSYMSYGLSWANASNTPFRLFKTWIHEGGIATPLIAHWPAVIRNHNGITRQPGHVMDILATCLDVAGIQYPKTYNDREITPLEGKSLMPIFQGKQRPEHEFLCWELTGNCAVRKGKWKLVEKANHIKHQSNAGQWDDWTTFTKHQTWELYDLEADRTEIHDLARQYPEKVSELTEIYERWAQRCGVQPWPIKKMSS